MTVASVILAVVSAVLAPAAVMPPSITGSRAGMMLRRLFFPCLLAAAPPHAADFSYAARDK
jgi:hypothetical protein